MTNASLSTISSPSLSSPAPQAALAVPPRVRAYDAGGWFYDLVVGSRLYHQLVWGMPPREHVAFARRALAAASPGPILDAGCGSLLFTAACYRETTRELTLLDASTTMLTRAARRLGPASRTVRLTQGDLRAIDLEPATFAATFHFGVLHCLDQPDRVLGELHRVTRPGGQLFLSCLTLGRPRGDAFLRRLARAGHVAPPRDHQTILATIAAAGFSLQQHRQQGSFLFVEALRP